MCVGGWGGGLCVWWFVVVLVFVCASAHVRGACVKSASSWCQTKGLGTKTWRAAEHQARRC